MPISRGQMPRQLYGLGSLVKSIGKAVKGAVKGVTKTIKKNPVLGLAALNFAPMLLPGGKPFIGLGGGQFNLPGMSGIKDLLTKKAADVTFGDTLKVGAMGTVLGGVLSKLEPQEEEEIVQKRNLGALKSKLTKAYQDLNYDPAEIPALVANDMSEYTQDMSRGVMAEGGRIGFFEGAVAGGGNISPGTDVGGNVRDDNPFAGGGGDGPQESPSVINTPPETKTNKGIVSILNRFNPFNFLFPPAAAAEFDMEAFQKAGAEKGFFGMNDELEAMQKYYDFAQKQKAMGKDPAAIRDSANIGSALYGIDMDLVPETFLQTEEDFTKQKAPISFFNLGGRAGYARGDTAEQNAIQASGIMDLPLNKNPAGITELDLRESGGFIPPVGVKEKADDIPAMLSSNEFVFPADAVRGMGDGNVNLGAQRMYDMMKKLENGGRV